MSGLRHLLGRLEAEVSPFRLAERPEQRLALLGPDDPEPDEPGVVGVRVSFAIESRHRDEDGVLMLSRLTDGELRELTTAMAKAAGKTETAEELERRERCVYAESNCDCHLRARAALPEEARSSTVTYVAQNLHRDPAYDVAAWLGAKAVERREREQREREAAAAGEKAAPAAAEIAVEPEAEAEPVPTPLAPPPARRREKPEHDYARFAPPALARRTRRRSLLDEIFGPD